MKDWLNEFRKGKTVGDCPKANDQLNEGFKVGEELAKQMRLQIIAGTAPLADRGNSFGATVALFACVWALVEWAGSGRKIVSKNSPVNHLWEAFEAAAMTDDKDLPAALDKLAKKWEGKGDGQS